MIDPNDICFTTVAEMTDIAGRSLVGMQFTVF